MIGDRSRSRGKQMSTGTLAAKRTTQLKNRLDELQPLLEERQRHLTGELMDINDSDVLTLTGWLVVRRREEALKRLLQKRITLVRATLEKAEHGTDSLCENCRSMIPEERLEVCPEATRCVDCQREQERRRRQK